MKFLNIHLNIHLLQPLLPVSRGAFGVGVVVFTIVLWRGIVLHQAEAAAVALVRERLVQPAKGKYSNIGSISLSILFARSKQYLFVVGKFKSLINICILFFCQIEYSQHFFGGGNCLPRRSYPGHDQDRCDCCHRGGGGEGLHVREVERPVLVQPCSSSHLMLRFDSRGDGGRG